MCLPACHAAPALCHGVTAWHSAVMAWHGMQTGCTGTGTQAAAWDWAETSVPAYNTLLPLQKRMGLSGLVTKLSQAGCIMSHVEARRIMQLLV